MGDQKTRRKEEPAPSKPEEKKQERRLLTYIKPVRKAAQRARKEARKTAQAVRESAEKALRKPVKTALRAALKIQETQLVLRLAPLAIVSGCGPFEEPHKPPSPNQEIPKIPVKEAKYWWPAYVVINGQLKDVSLGFTEETKPYDASKMFSSPDSIPQEMRKKGRDAISKALDFSKFFLKDDVYNRIVKDDVFFPVASGNWILWAATGFRMIGPEGEEIAACYEGCPEYQQMIHFPSETGTAVLHELFHVSWSLLTESDKKQFTKKVLEFYNGYSQNSRQDELLSGIWGGGRPDLDNPDNPDQIIPVFKPFLTGPELDDWANEKLTTLEDDSKTRVKQALRDYLRIFSDIVDFRTHGSSEQNRAGFLVGEGYSYMGANFGLMKQIFDGQTPTEQRYIPAFISPTYRKIMKDRLVDQLATDGSGYFIDLKKFYEFKSYLRDFVDYMIARYPELQS